MRYGRASELLEELLKETGSHLYAEMHGYDWPASFSDIAQMLHAEWFMNVHRDREASREPIKLPTPWSQKDANADVTPEELAELTEKLLARSALRDR